jgi:hypothetical protein
MKHTNKSLVSRFFLHLLSTSHSSHQLTDPRASQWPMHRTTFLTSPATNKCRVYRGSSSMTWTLDSNVSTDPIIGFFFYILSFVCLFFVWNIYGVIFILCTKADFICCNNTYTMFSTLDIQWCCIYSSVQTYSDRKVSTTEFIMQNPTGFYRGYITPPARV